MRIRYNVGRGYFGMNIGFDEENTHLITINRYHDSVDDTWNPVEINWSACGSVDVGYAVRFRDLMTAALEQASSIGGVTPRKYCMDIETEDGERNYYFSAPHQTFAHKVKTEALENNVRVLSVIEVDEFGE